MNKKIFRIVVDCYIEQYRATSLFKNFTFRCTDSQAKSINNFISKIEKQYDPLHLTVDFFNDYFSFQFNRYYKIKTPYGRGSVMLNWLIGDKAIELWLNRDKKKASFSVMKNINADTKSVKKKILKTEQSFSELLLNTQLVEENSKAKYHNTTKGLLYCYTTTTLYNHKSKFCSTCKSAEICKDTLKKEQPKLYRLRSYGI